MKFDWRYAFHSFWFLMTLLLLMTPAFFSTQVHPVRATLGPVIGFMIVDELLTHHYPYFNRLHRQGITVIISVGFIVLLALLSWGINPAWPGSVWGLVIFGCASFGGTIDGYLVNPTRILPGDTLQDVRRKSLIMQKPIDHENG